jgi:hypothetical protein
MVGRSEWVVPTPVLKNGHDPSVGEGLDPDGRYVTVMRPIGHHDDQLIGIDLDGMLSPVQWATLEHGGICVTTGVSHTSDDAIARRTELSPTRTGCRIPCSGAGRRNAPLSLFAASSDEFVA